MLENATPENIDSYRQLIVALPEFQEGINTSSDKRNVLRYNKSIETILKIVLVFVIFVLFFFDVKSILYIFALGNIALPLYIQIE